MKKQFIVVSFECGNSCKKVLRYDAADYCGASNDVQYQIRRISDDYVVLMVPMSRIFYVSIMEEEI